MKITATLILCTKNGGERLRTCLEHIASLKADDPLQVILVDNGSDDGISRSIMEEHVNKSPHMTELVDCPLPGNGAGRNRALSFARGEFLLFIDDDCYPDSEFVRCWVKMLREHPRIGVAGGMIRPYESSQSFLGCITSEEPSVIKAGTFVHRGYIQGSNMAFRAASLASSDAFDEKFGAGMPYAGEEWDLALAIVFAGWDAGYFPEPAVWHDHRRGDDASYQRILYYEYGAGAVYLKNSFGRGAITIWKVALRDMVRLRNDRARLMAFIKGACAFASEHLFRNPGLWKMQKQQKARVRGPAP